VKQKIKVVQIKMIIFHVADWINKCSNSISKGMPIPVLNAPAPNHLHKFNEDDAFSREEGTRRTKVLRTNLSEGCDKLCRQREEA
jgi:hypothetical protein